MSSIQGLCFTLADLLRGQAPDPAVVAARDAERKRRQGVARDHVKTWLARAVTPPTFVSQGDYANRLLELIDRPYLIRQTGFEVCGPNAILAAVLHDYPDDVAKFATTLFERKTAMLGKVPLSLNVTVCARTLDEIEAGCRAVKKTAPPGADWILFSAVQNDMQPGFNGLPAGVQLQFLENRRFLDDTQLYGVIKPPVAAGSSLDPKLSAKRENDQQLILLFLHSGKIGKGGADLIETPNHLVYLERVDAFENNGDDWAVFTMYSWGERLTQSYEVGDFMGAVKSYIYGTRSY